MAASDYVDEALAILGGEDTEFYLGAKDGRVIVSCRYRDCSWGESCAEIELWEFVTDAREHWETSHSKTPPAGDMDRP
jgi:hypothetical protein